MKNSIIYLDETIDYAEDCYIKDNISVYFYGENNMIYLNKLKGKGTLRIEVFGKENIFKIGIDNTICSNLYIFFCMNTLKEPIGTLVEIKNGNIFNGNVSITSPIEPGRKVVIGNDNLFGNNILLRGRNEHTIFNRKSLKRINVDKNIEIGNENWICDEVRFLPKSSIANGSVVAERAFVNREFNRDNILLAGMPAKIKKKNIGWNILTNASFNVESPLNRMSDSD